MFFYVKLCIGWKTLERCAALCNRAEFKPGQSGVPVLKRDVNGDASEAALLKCVELSLGDTMAFRTKHRFFSVFYYDESMSFSVV